MSEVAFFAGLDGGGSATRAVVVDAAGRERGRGAAEGSNYAAVGLERAVARIQAAVAEATRAAGSQLPLTAAWIGLAGVDRPADGAALAPHLRGLAGVTKVTNDAELVLAALPGAHGVALIAGTGSIAFGRDAAGATARAGGWGHLIGDEGSGYDLGRRALRAASQAADGRGPATALLEAIVAHWGLDRPQEMIDRVYHGGGDDKAEIARLSGLVFAAARAGDAVARRLVDQAAADLAVAAVAVGERLDFPDGRLPLALSGGLLLGEPELRERVLRRVRARRSVAGIATVADPALSAARAAVGLVESGHDRQGGMPE